MNKNTVKICLFVITGLTACISTSNAQWTNDTMINTMIRDTALMDGSGTKIATTTNGRSYISWAEKITNGYCFRMQLLDTNGRKLWRTNGIIIDSMIGSTLYNYNLAVDRDDNALIALQDLRTGGKPIPVIFKIDQQGNMLWGSQGIQLNDTAQTDGLGPTIGVTDNNNVVVAWSAGKDTAAYISAVKLSAAGFPLWSDNLRIGYPIIPDEQYDRPSIVLSSGENIFIQYAKRVGFGLGNSTLFVQRYDNSGQPQWHTPTPVSDQITGQVAYPRPVSDGYNGLFINFTATNAVNQTLSDVYAQRVYADGHTWNRSGKVLSTGVNSQKFEAGCVFVRSQNAYFAGIYETNLSQSASGIAIQKIDTAGAILLGTVAPAIIPVSSTAISAGKMSDVEDGIIFQYAIEDNTSTSIRVIKSNYTGALAWPASVAITTATGTKSNYVMGSYAHDQLVIAWNDNRFGNGGVYAQNVRRDGTRGIPNPSGIHKIGGSQMFEAFPNPAQQSFTVRIKQGISGEVQVSIFSISGQVVCQDKQAATNGAFLKTYDLSNHPKGLYIVEVKSSKGTDHVKMTLR
jgi:hypothetical protein